MDYKLGIIGGMGTEATSCFLEEISKHTKVNKDQDHIDMIILNHASIPDRTKAILSGDTEELIEALGQDIELLEDLDVANIVIPCNTTHYFYEELQEKTPIPIINMVEETIKAALNNFSDVKKIGIIATDGTIQAEVYHKKCEEYGIETIIPSKNRQKEVMSLIYDDIKKGHLGDETKFNRVYDELVRNGSDVIILACTELSVYKKRNKVPNICLDALDILVEKSIKRSDAVYK